MKNALGNTLAVQHLRAKLDVNGNPQRLFVLYEIEESELGRGYAKILEVRDEGYAGEPEEFKHYPELPSVDIPLSEYRRLLKMTKEL